MGDLPKRNHTRKSERICVKVYLYSRKDRKELTKAANEAGVPVSEYLRHLIADVMRKRREEREKQ